jgi:drug/metabolite transporter (DMT)-like permease
MNVRDGFELVLLSAVWALAFIFMRVAVPEFGPVPLIALRVLIAALFLVLVLGFRKGLMGMRKNTLDIAFVGVMNSALPFSLFAFAALYISAGFSAILNATTPLFGAILVYFWLKERLSFSRIFGLIIGFSGVVILVSGTSTFSFDASTWASLAALLGAFLYAFSANYTKVRLSHVDPLAIATGSQISAALFLAPFAVLWWPEVTPSLLSWWNVLGLGIFCTGVTYLFYFRLLRRIGPSKVILLTYLLPVFGILWGFLFLKEVVTPVMLLGTVITFLGTAFAAGTLTLPRMRPKPI